ncbi:MAG: phosphotransferase, partial [Anaerolineaceae bacterium]|nr:phosphotransferase [Anaerolineaceae bacterium]
GVCHGELYGGDVLYSPDGIPVIFDFDSSGCGWRALELAVFTGSSDWMDTSQEALVRRKRETGQFLDGYTSIRALSSGELEVLRLDSAVHHIFLMGLVLSYWSTRDGWHWADDSFIDWHMQWFRHWIEQHKI